MALIGQVSRRQTLSPAVAGAFYPADPRALRETVAGHLARQRAAAPGPCAPVALIVPHAGLRYSGDVAAAAYRTLGPDLRLVVLIGPAHYVAFDGIALPRARALSTPLGAVPVDQDAADRIAGLPGVVERDDAHLPEHCLEVQLPFLQQLAAGAPILPLLVGAADDGELVGVIEALPSGEPGVVLVVSSDLSHFHEYRTACRLDESTARQIENLEPEGLTGENACGYRGIRALLIYARRHALTPTPLARCNSGDTAGDRRRVVGYGAWRFDRRSSTGGE